ncbi:hypothetical protein [Serratia fonticola]
MTLHPISISQASLDAAPNDIANVAGINRDTCRRRCVSVCGWTKTSLGTT